MKQIRGSSVYSGSSSVGLTPSILITLCFVLHKWRTENTSKILQFLSETNTRLNQGSEATGWTTAQAGRGGGLQGMGVKLGFGSRAWFWGWSLALGVEPGLGSGAWPWGWSLALEVELGLGGGAWPLWGWSSALGMELRGWAQATVTATRMEAKSGCSQTRTTAALPGLHFFLYIQGWELHLTP